MVNQIKFSHNWNGKLDLRVFTTIRRWTQNKANYYGDLLGHNFEVILKGKKKCIVELQSIEVLEFSDIPSGLLMFDTGHDEQESKEIFAQFGLMQLPNNKAIILTFMFKEDGASLTSKEKVE